MKLDPRSIMQVSMIAEEASFTKAAARLGVAQPWLSVRVRKLEEQLGFLLFLRNTRNVTLTDRGAEFLQAARSVMAAMEGAEALALQLRRRDEKRLRIGVPPYSDQIRERRQLIDRYTREYRDVVVELEVGWSPSLLARVRSGDLDVAFVMGRAESNDLESIPLCTIKLDLLMSRNNPLANQDMIALHQLAGRPIALLSRATHPSLIDELSMPLIKAGARLVQIPEINDNLFDRFHGPEQLIAVWFHFIEEQFSEAEVAWRPLDTSPKAQFSLIKRLGTATPTGRSFWKMANASGHQE
jgi:DNA-binding transcriptional LysR family regulator